MKATFNIDTFWEKLMESIFLGGYGGTPRSASIEESGDGRSATIYIEPWGSGDGDKLVYRCALDSARNTPQPTEQVFFFLGDRQNGITVERSLMHAYKTSGQDTRTLTPDDPPVRRVDCADLMTHCANYHIRAVIISCLGA